MKNFLLLMISFVSLVNPVFPQTIELERQLFNLPDVIFEQIEAPPDFEVAYELKIRQPVDHLDASKGYFYQRAFLSHRSFERPMVINTAGYAKRSNGILEITNFLDANQIAVEHRYFGESLPDSLDYRYLTLKRATADLHHIYQRE